MRLVNIDDCNRALFYKQFGGKDSLITVESAFNMLEALPTAYDTDKVVEELEIRVNEANNNCLCEMHENGHTLDFENENGRIKGLKEASEIVKQGGVSDDVCEWESASDGEFIQNPHTKRLYSNEPSIQNVYCNTYGKKIKVVE